MKIRMPHNDRLTVSELREWFQYNPETGEVFWKKNHARMRAGDLAGCPKRTKWTVYIQVSLFDHDHVAHRIAWALQTGNWPNGPIDHANCIGIDNRWVNLRLATPSQNSANSRKQVGKILPKGITTKSLANGTIRYVARGNKEHKRHFIGSFETIHDAEIAYENWAKQSFGEFARV
jgi:hypothetical protein